jgi:alpha-ribazole phosphatase
MQVALVRHPAAQVARGVCYGRLDVRLAPAAAADIARIAVSLHGFGTRVWTSPARRCLVVARALTDAPVVDARLLEMDFGTWEGIPWDAVPRPDLDRWAADPAGFTPPGGESAAAVLARVAAFHADLVARGEDCVVVAHGGPLKLLAALLRGEAPDVLAPAPGLGSVVMVAARARLPRANTGG